MVNSGKNLKPFASKSLSGTRISARTPLSILQPYHPVSTSGYKTGIATFITQFVRFLFFASIHVPYPCYIKSPNIHVGCQKQVLSPFRLSVEMLSSPSTNQTYFPWACFNHCVPGFTKASVRLIHNMQVSVYRYKALHHIHAIVRSAVIHHNDFHSFRILRKYALKKFPNVCLNIIHGDNDG